MAKSQNYILHIIGSLLFISIPILASPDLSNSHVGLINALPFRRAMLTFILLLVFFYANYLYFIPRFYFTRKFVLFFSIAVLAFLVISNLPHVVFPFKGHGFPFAQGGGMPPRTLFPHRRPMPFIAFFFGGSLLQFLLVFSLSFLLRVNRRLTDIESEKRLAI